MYDDNDTGLGLSRALRFCVFAVVTLGVAMLVGAEISAPSHLKTGRDTGIIFCTEKPAQCRTEYNYLKLKETQK